MELYTYCCIITDNMVTSVTSTSTITVRLFTIHLRVIPLTAMFMPPCRYFWSQR